VARGDEANAQRGDDAAAGQDAGPLLVVLSGPSGAGKDTIINALRERDHPYHFTVTATTRPPRPHEREGIDYYFHDEAGFRRMIVAGELIEHVLYDGTYRGVPRAPVARALTDGRDVVMRTDVRGARTIKQRAPDAVLIYILPPGLDVLGERMRGRDAQSAQEAARRLALVQEELAALRDFDYAVLNEEGLLDRAVDQVEAIMTAERCRVGRRRVEI
jgi:guanylate kinase